MAIQFVGEGGQASGTAGVTVALPTGLAAGDLMLLTCETANEAVTAPSGWTLAPNGDQAAIGTAASTGATRMTVFYRIATSSESAVTVADPGNHICAAVTAYRGVDAINPFVLTATNSGSSATPYTLPSCLSTRGGQAQIVVLANDVDSNTSPFGALSGNYGSSGTASWTNTAETTLNKNNPLAAGATNAGNGGAYGIYGYGVATSGSAGFTSIGLISGGTVVAAWCCILRDPIQFVGSLTSTATASSTATNIPFSIESVGAASGVTRAVLPSYQTGDLILGMAYRDGSTTPPTVPSGWTTLQTAVNTTSSAVVVSKTASGSYTNDGWGVAVQQSFPATTGQWSTVAYGAGVFVTVSNGTSDAATSPDGVTWTKRSLPVTSSWGEIIYGNGLFLTISSNGTSSVAATSPDGITWTQRALPVSANWHGVTYGNGVFVAVAYNSTIAATSPDGITWTQRTMPVSATWYCIAYGSGVFVAIAGGVAANYAATSADGITWTQRAMPASVNWNSVTYGNGVFLAIATGPSNISATSPDGITWTQRTMPASALWSENTYGNGVFLAIATGPSNISATSPDGITWTQRTMPASSYWIGVAYGLDVFVATSSSGLIAATITPNTITDSFTNATSVAFNVYRGVDNTAPVGNVISNTGTGTTATIPALPLSQPARNPFEVGFVGSLSSDVAFPSGASNLLGTLPSNASWRGVGYGAGKYVAVTTNAAAYSSDGVTWSAATITSFSWYSMAYSGSLFLTVCAGAAVAATSPDGVTWTNRTLPVSANWICAAYGGGMFVALSYNATSSPAASSPDGITWTQRSMPVNSKWSSVTYGNGIFVAVSDSSSIAATSPDGITWTQRTLPVSSTWNSVAFGNGVFVALAYSSQTAATSTDGITWTARSMPSYSDWQEVSFGGGFFVAPIYNSRFAAVSSDGINWETLDLGKVASWTSIGYGARGFSVVSSGTDSDLVDVSIKDKFKLRTSSIDAVDAIASYDSGGKATQVSYSPGSTWSTVGSQSLAFSGKVAYGKNVFVIMSTSTGTSAAVSSNGVNWTSSPMPVSSSWSVITYGSGLFAAFTGGTVYATSPDGWTWTQRSLTTTNGVASVVYGGGQFVALSSSSTEGFTSPDGINWTQRTLPSAKIWTALAYGNGVYVASSGNGSQGVITSPDGVTWTERTPPFMGRTLVFGNGVFVMVPAGSTSTAATSTDGITWTTVTLPVTAWYGAATYANGLFVLGSISQNATILTSTDGSNWTVASSSYYVNDLTYGNGKFLGTQYSSYGIIVSEG